MNHLCPFSSLHEATLHQAWRMPAARQSWFLDTSLLTVETGSYGRKCRIKPLNLEKLKVGSIALPNPLLFKWILSDSLWMDVRHLLYIFKKFSANHFARNSSGIRGTLMWMLVDLINQQGNFTLEGFCANTYMFMYRYMFMGIYVYKYV